MAPRYKHFLIALILTLGVVGATMVKASAQTETPPRATADNCASCHSEIHAAWHKGAHGDAQSNDALAQQGNCLACHKEIPEASMPNLTKTNSSFNTYWVDQGQPNNCLQCHVTGFDPSTGTWKADGITCEACHGPIPSNHPKDNMPIDRNTDLCRACHTDARFGWAAWKQSVHYQNNMTCSTCHNPHSTSLKLGGQPNEDASALCENCHKELAQKAVHSNHAKAGVTCITCHLGPSKGTDDFHKVPDHDFKPKLEACNSCHADQMHSLRSPSFVSTPQVIPTAHIESPVTQEPVVTNTPTLVNPFGYTGLAGLLGVVGGFVWRIRGKRRPPRI